MPVKRVRLMSWHEIIKLQGDVEKIFVALHEDPVWNTRFSSYFELLQAVGYEGGHKKYYKEKFVLVETDKTASHRRAASETVYVMVQGEKRNG